MRDSDPNTYFQKLWNWRLIQHIKRWVLMPRLAILLERMVIHIDSVILCCSVILKRLQALGLVSLWKTQPKQFIQRPVVYIDAGLHQNGAELGFTINKVLPAFSERIVAYGFEANRRSFDIVSEKYADRPSVQIEHAALVHTDANSSQVKLYHNGASGISDSLYRVGPDYEMVPGVSLPVFINKHSLLDENAILILRMNIEGAEYDVLQDLVKSGLHHRIACYMGMWDDLSKIDQRQDQQFSRFLKHHSIKPVTFNARDLSWPLRRWSISYHLYTCIMTKC